MVLNCPHVLPIIGFLISCTSTKKEIANASETIENPTNQVVLSSEIVWEKLNPARGDKSPQAGTVFGDRKGKVPTGFLAKFVDGFSSPPHIHNVSYRAVVIKGLVHNDDPEAADMWMPPGSFWTQPAGESHITSAKEEENIAYVEIDSGPYLVKPTSEAFDNGERPVNIDASNVVWLSDSQTNWIGSGSDAEISFLWEREDSGLRGLFVKLPRAFQGKIQSSGDIFRSIVVIGELNYKMPQEQELKILDAGSYFTSTNRAFHQISNRTQEESILYIQTNGTITIDGMQEPEWLQEHL